TEITVLELVIPSANRWWNAGSCSSERISSLRKTTRIYNKVALVVALVIVHHHLVSRHTQTVLDESTRGSALGHIHEFLSFGQFYNLVFIVGDIERRDPFKIP